MKLIVGLGNPGEKYAGTRHNAGFMFVEKLAQNSEIAPVEQALDFQKNDKFDSLMAQTSANGEKIILAKPQTFMNLSGESVAKIMAFYKIESKDIIVALDDVDLPLGIVRFRNEGSSAGHKGLQNIIDKIGDDKFTRIRIGIESIGGSRQLVENPESVFDTKDFVLSKFSDRELPLLNLTIDRAIGYFIEHFGSKDDFLPAHTIEASFDSIE